MRVPVRSFVAADEEPVLAADGLTPELALAAVVVEPEPTVVEKARERNALIARVGHCLADRTLGQDLRLFVIDPSEEAVEHRTGTSDALARSSLGIAREAHSGNRAALEAAWSSGTYP